MKTTWFIHGASAGLGLHLAWAAAAAGHRVFATGHDRRRLAGVLGPDHEDLATFSLDAVDPAEAQAAVDAAIARFGALDILVHEPTQARMSFAGEPQGRQLHAQFALDFFGASHLIEAALPFMRAAGRGRFLHLPPTDTGLGVAETLIEAGAFRTGFLTSSTMHFGRNATQLAQSLVRLASERHPLPTATGRQQLH
jgi:NAD(P)-dependent dehydrogenase (short-subunit alcohol dehydrogenase family)